MPLIRLHSPPFDTAFVCCLVYFPFGAAEALRSFELSWPHRSGHPGPTYRTRTNLMTEDARASPWLKRYIDSLYNQDFGDETKRIVGDDCEEFRHGYVIASLEIGVARSLFLSTWEEIRLRSKPLANQTVEIRNFVTHGVDVVWRGPPPFARLINARNFSQSYSVSMSWNAAGALEFNSHCDYTDMKKLQGLNKSRNVYRFVNNQFAKKFIETYASSQLEQCNELAGLTALEIF